MQAAVGSPSRSQPSNKCEVVISKYFERQQEPDGHQNRDNRQRAGRTYGGWVPTHWVTISPGCSKQRGIGRRLLKTGVGISKTTMSSKPSLQLTSKEEMAPSCTDAERTKLSIRPRGVESRRSCATNTSELQRTLPVLSTSMCIYLKGSIGRGNDIFQVLV